MPDPLAAASSCKDEPRCQASLVSLCLQDHACVVEEVPVATSVSPVKALTNDQLKALLKDAGATGCSKLRKDELIAKLAEVTSASKTTPVVEEVPVATVSPVKAEVTTAPGCSQV
jgi:hypothetical protein